MDHVALRERLLVLTVSVAFAFQAQALPGKPADLKLVKVKVGNNGLALGRGDKTKKGYVDAEVLGPNDVLSAGLIGDPNRAVEQPIDPSPLPGLTLAPDTVEVIIPYVAGTESVGDSIPVVVDEEIDEPIPLPEEIEQPDPVPFPDPPVDPTDPPVDPTDPTDPPIDPTDPPVDPIDPADPPVDPPVDPADPADPPVDPVDPPEVPTVDLTHPEDESPETEKKPAYSGDEPRHESKGGSSVSATKAVTDTLNKAANNDEQSPSGTGQPSAFYAGIAEAGENHEVGHLPGLGATISFEGNVETATANGARVVERYVERILFNFDSAEFGDDGKRAAAAILNYIRLQSGADFSIEIHGHADSSGAESYNQTLSERRAKAVRDYLIELGASASSISITAKGELVPATDNTSEFGRQSNRRADVYVEPQSKQ